MNRKERINAVRFIPKADRREYPPVIIIVWGKKQKKPKTRFFNAGAFWLPLMKMWWPTEEPQDRLRREVHREPYWLQ